FRGRWPEGRVLGLDTGVGATRPCPDAPGSVVCRLLEDVVHELLGPLLPLFLRRFGVGPVTPPEYQAADDLHFPDPPVPPLRWYRASLLLSPVVPGLFVGLGHRLVQD